MVGDSDIISPLLSACSQLKLMTFLLCCVILVILS